MNKFIFLFLIFSLAANSNNFSFENPNVNVIEQHTVNLLNAGKIIDKETGYVFKVDELNFSRTDYLVNIESLEKTVELYAYTKCGIKYTPLTEEVSKYDNYYSLIHIIYDIKGNIKHILPAFIDLDCPHQAMKMEKPILTKSKQIEFKNPFDFKKPSNLTLVTLFNHLVDAGKISNYDHVFSSDELEVNEISYSVFNKTKQNVIVISTSLKCDVEFIIDSKKGIKALYSGLIIYLSLTGKVLKTFEIIGKSKGLKCKI